MWQPLGLPFSWEHLVGGHVSQGVGSDAGYRKPQYRMHLGDFPSGIMVEKRDPCAIHKWPCGKLPLHILSFLEIVLVPLPFFFLLIRFLSLFIYFEREREGKQVGRGREREFLAVFTLSVRSLMRGSNSRTVRSRPEPKPAVGCLTR